jgi:hypothetical protein
MGYVDILYLHDIVKPGPKVNQPEKLSHSYTNNTNSTNLQNFNTTNPFLQTQILKENGA